MRFRKPIPFLVLLVFCSISAFAITDRERAELERLRGELKSLQTIVDSAQQSANTNDWRQVDYVKLQEDINRIIKGLDDAVNSVRREPREVPALKGEYLNGQR